MQNGKFNKKFHNMIFGPASFFIRPANLFFPLCKIVGPVTNFVTLLKIYLFVLQFRIFLDG